MQDKNTVEAAEITTAFHQGVDDSHLVQQSCFFAYLDILGFKSLVKQCSANQLKGIVDAFIADIPRTIDESRTIAGLKIDWENKIKVRIVSDSIYVWTVNDDRLIQFDDLLHIVNAMLVCGFRHGLPLRGVVTYGELFSGDIKVPSDIPKDFSFEAGSLYGRALVEVYELEGQMDWCGAILTPRAWAEVVRVFEREIKAGAGRIMRSVTIKSAEGLFILCSYFVWYDVPFKGGTKKAIAYNWNYEYPCALSDEVIRRAFVGRCNDVNDAVKQKLQETIRFYEYTKHVRELRQSGLQKRLPIPDPAYVLSDL